MRLFVKVRNAVCYLEIFGGRVKNLEIISRLEVTWRLPQKPGGSRQNLETWQACKLHIKVGPFGYTLWKFFTFGTSKIPLYQKVAKVSIQPLVLNIINILIHSLCQKCDSSYFQKLFKENVIYSRFYCISSKLSIFQKETFDRFYMNASITI